MQRHLHQDVAQLLAEKGAVCQIDGFQHLTGLFQKIHADGLVCLHTVPGAAAHRAAQQADDLHQIVHSKALFPGQLHVVLPFHVARGRLQFGHDPAFKRPHFHAKLCLILSQI